MQSEPTLRWRDVKDSRSDTLSCPMGVYLQGTGYISFSRPSRREAAARVTVACRYFPPAKKIIKKGMVVASGDAGLRTAKKARLSFASRRRCSKLQLFGGATVSNSRFVSKFSSYWMPRPSVSQPAGVNLQGWQANQGRVSLQRGCELLEATTTIAKQCAYRRVGQSCQ